MLYLGGKRKIQKDIVPIINNLIFVNNIKTYIEPFVGGANIIEAVKCENRIAYDINKDLIELYKHVQNGGGLPEHVNKEIFDQVKYNKEQYEGWYIAAVGFLGGYRGRGINDTCGVYDDAEDYRNTYKCKKETFEKQIPLLKDIHFENKDYREVNAQGCLIYCDPPYKGTVQYINNKGKNRFNSETFWDWCREMSKKNIVLISEQEGPEDFDIILDIEITRCITSKRREQNKKNERLFIHKSLNYFNKDFDF